MKKRFIGIGNALFALWWIVQGSSPVWAQPNTEPAGLDTIGVRELIAIQPNLTGQLVSVGLVELPEISDANQPCYAFLPNFEHRAFSHLNLEGLYYYDNPHRPPCYSRHATMIAGILFGHDEQAALNGLGAFTYRGIVPDAAAHVYEANWFIYKQAAHVASPTLNDDVLSISWGTDAADRITMWWQWGFDALVERDSTVMVAGCGNGTDGFTGISKPSWGYNVISVGTAGNLGRFPDNLRYAGPPAAQDSSFGPTDDGRCKPDLIACGFSLGPSADSLSDYCHDRQSKSFSSFAAPQVAGAAALLIDAARQNMIPDGDDPRVIKALLLNGAQKLLGWHKGLVDSNDDAAVPLDYQQGAGLVNVMASYQQLMAGASNSPASGENMGWDLNRLSLDPNDQDAVQVYFMPQTLLPGRYLHATLCWYLSYEIKGIYRPLPLHDLRLELWTVNEYGQLDTLLDYSDSPVDNVEHIYFQNPTEQYVALVVRGIPDPDHPADYETFALAFSEVDSYWQGDRLAGDLNLDGLVDQQDIAALLRCWRLTRTESAPVALQNYPAGDINFDGTINMADLQTLLQQWQQRSPWHAGHYAVQ
ncbi:MAG: hypothetical protein BWY71_00338 [Planctomycetes bacterium ADurb.Bin412]|nr:MAG: hypothetical protein BWY71_00338 [Planctomycetes bacterium ADurb.Bin412]